MSLSRLHDELFLKDTRYACDFWEEHAENFKNMLFDLLTEESLLKILSVSKETSITFNERINAFSGEDNEKLIRAAYDRLELLIQPERNFDHGKEAPAFNGKKFLYDGMCAYFSVLTKAKEESGKPLSDIFLSHKDVMKDFLEPLTPDNYTLDNMLALFAPQLLIYFSYLIWKYDQAMEGVLVEEYFKQFKQRRENMAHPEKVQEIWTNIHDSGDPELNEDMKETSSEEQDTATAGQKNEAWIFQDSASRQRDGVEGFWTQKGSEIREKYNKKTTEEKRALLEDVRNIISDMGKGIYQNALMYCPELNPAKLSGVDMQKSQYSYHSLDDLVEFVRKQKELPKITPKNQSEVIGIIKDPSYGDDFITSISKKLGPSQAKLLPLVAVSRQHLLFVFCHLAFVQILGLPLSVVTDTIPGCSDEAPNSSSSGGSLNIPFSTREQRDATPIGKPPIPNILKKQNERKRTEDESKEEKIEPSSVEEVKDSESEKVKNEVRCSEPSCGKLEKENEHFQVCSFCKKNHQSIPYCSKDCQIKHWRSEHKHVCYKNNSVAK